MKTVARKYQAGAIRTILAQRQAMAEINSERIEFVEVRFFVDHSDSSSAEPKGAIMRPARFILYVLIVGVSTLASRISAQTRSSTYRIVIAANSVLDGKGNTLKKRDLVENTSI